MSDTSQGPGWWLASDGKWYPPQPAPAARPEQEPWWKRWWVAPLVILLGVCALVAVMQEAAKKGEAKRDDPRYQQVREECVRREVDVYGERSFRIGTRELTRAAADRINRCMVENY